MRNKVLTLIVAAAMVGAGSYFAINYSGLPKSDGEGESLDGMSSVAAAVDGKNGNGEIRPLDGEAVISADDLKRNFDQLSVNAERQPALAYSLAKLLFECRTLARSLDSAEELISSDRVPAENKGKLLDEVERKVGRCDGLSKKQIASYVDMIDFAARSGVVEAQLSYSDYVADAMLSPESIANPERIVDYKRKSLEYYNRALGQGEVKALGLLSAAYENGILAEKDMYKAYVYAYAYALAKGHGVSASQWLAQMEAALTVSQLQSARSEAQQVYARCCRR